jgi:YD repeat-containing protein
MKKDINASPELHLSFILSTKEFPIMPGMSAETSFKVTYDAQGRLLSRYDESGVSTVFAFDLADRLSVDGLSVNGLDVGNALGGKNEPAKEAGCEEQGEAGDEDGTGPGTGTSIE